MNDKPTADRRRGSKSLDSSLHLRRNRRRNCLPRLLAEAVSSRDRQRRRRCDSARRHLRPGPHPSRLEASNRNRRARNSLRRAGGLAPQSPRQHPRPRLVRRLRRLAPFSMGNMIGERRNVSRTKTLYAGRSGYTATGKRKWTSSAQRSITRNAMILPSGPADPPVSHFGPRTDVFR